jgi:hypothetical protein
MKRLLVLIVVLGLATVALAEKREINGRWYSLHPTNRGADQAAKTARPGRVVNLTYHGSDVLTAAKVVPIFWGSYWGSGTGATERSTMVGFFSQFGTNSHYGVITQYYDTVYGGTRYIGLSTLTNSGDDWYDSSNPPSNVTDSAVQSEVQKYLAAHGFKALDGHGVDQAIYEVFIPPSSYSSNGTYTSCGGPHLYYCAYHGAFTYGGKTVKYSIEPYPSCSGCQASGFTALQNAQHFACHETREAVTDPTNAWWDKSGSEADDKCAWSPAPFVDGGYGYQYEWSNANGGCIK